MKTAVVGILDFVKRQTPESHYDHFEGSWNELVELVTVQWGKRTVSPNNSGVVLVPMPEDQLHRFFTSVIQAKPDMPFEVEYGPRLDGEAPFLQIHTRGYPKSQAKSAEIICYSHETLDADGDAPSTREAEYYIVSINAYATPDGEPMRPMTMARNFLHLTGGTEPEIPYTAEDFAKAIVFWSQHVRIKSS